MAGYCRRIGTRCSVHCKSDVTHKLNRQEATRQDVLHTLHDSMANKVVSLLEKGQRPLNRLLAVGGVTQNRAMIASLREKLPHTEVVVLPESPYFEALGTALLTRAEPIHPTPNLTPRASLGTLPRLAEYASRVTLVPAPHWHPLAAGPSHRRVKPAGRFRELPRY